MDDLIRDALNAAALRSDCPNHPGEYASNRTSDGTWVCWLCVKDMPKRDHSIGPFGRAYATGLGSEAAQEAREAQRYAEEYERMRPGRTPMKGHF